MLCIQVPRLTEGANYIFRVYAENEVGAGPAEELMQSVAPKGLMGNLMSCIDIRAHID